MIARAFGQALLGLAIMIAGAGAASAGSFAVSPVRVTLTAGQAVQTLTVRNTGETEAVIQLEVLKWTQQDGRDLYEPSREVLATPPIFTVPPRSQQVIRVGLRTSPDAARELSYRLFLSEVPPPPMPGVQGLQIALQISLPVFIKPMAVAKPALQWRAARDPQGLRLSATNTGAAHVQITHLRLSQPGTDALVDKFVSDYLLPGQTHSWLLAPTAAPAALLQLQAQSDAGEQKTEVAVD